MAKNALLKLLAQKTVPIGIQCFTSDDKLIEVLGKTGFDYVWLDTEHSALNPRALEQTMRTCEAAGLIPLVRIPDPQAARRPAGRWKQAPKPSSFRWYVPPPMSMASSTR